MTTVETQLVDDDSLEDIIDFFRYIDKLKRVSRQSSLIPNGDGESTRRETVAEHSWHVAMLALLMEDRLEKDGLDVGRIIRMLLVHDLAEIISGDLIPFEHTRSQLHGRDVSASEELLELAPKKAGQTLQKLLAEFRQKETLEAVRAHSLDRAHPVLMNIANGGDVWIRNDVPAAYVRGKMIGFIQDTDPEFYSYLASQLDDAESKGFFPVTEVTE